jgi:diguanylate cyclase (GGDEF)-like protein
VLRTAARHRVAQRAMQERDTLHSLAHSDPLTGLLNRRGLDEALRAAIPRMGGERILAVYVIDLDGFKPVNDQYGHDVGDQLLLVAAQRLRGCVRSGDGVARIGGDEFVVMAAGLSAASQAEELGLKIIEAFRSPFALHERTCRVSCTVGYALSPPLERDAAALLKAADAAMYAGKEGGKDRLQPVAA